MTLNTVVAFEARDVPCRRSLNGVSVVNALVIAYPRATMARSNGAGISITRVVPLAPSSSVPGSVSVSEPSASGVSVNQANPPDNGLLSDARVILRNTFGFSVFRPLQGDIIGEILGGQDVFVLMPTGGGKSLCYQIPALAMDGMTVVVSPLIALMKDQVDALQALGVAATFINSSLGPTEIRRRQQAVVRGEVKLLYVAPERFAAQRFLELLKQVNVAMFAIDEAHCISEWGHDFRPDYRELTKLRTQFPTAVISAFTATATDKVQNDIREQLGLGSAASFRASFNRPNLFYEVRNKTGAFDQLTAYLRSRGDVSGIVYCGSRVTTENVSQRLREKGYSAAAYHAGLESTERQAIQEAFVRDDVRIIVATVAFGMGIDKPDVRFVIHYDLPKNLEGYYQESGRAGRDGDPSDCILFYSYADVARQQRFVDQKPTAALRSAAIEQLRQMSGWAEARTCRRVELLAYFGEAFSGQDAPCCDNCRNPAELIDFTIAAQMFLSCVKRTGERFGSAYVIDVLRGARSERILRFGHNRLSTYGIGREQAKHEWQYLARELVKHGYAVQDAEQFNRIRITSLGYSVLFKGATVMLPSAPEQRRRSTYRNGDHVEIEHPDLFDLLRKLRKKVADDRGVPPYVVFPDATLRAMASRLPRDRTSLRAIAGVGETKLADFGATFLSAISGYVARTGAMPALTPGPPAPSSLRPRPSGPSASARHSLALFREGLSPAEIAEERDRSLTTIEEHLVEAVEAGESLDIHRLVSAVAFDRISAAISRVGDESLRALMDELGSGYSYTELKLTRAALRATTRQE
jgi:ATP-dependent DNA helicase RecQ